MYNLRQYTNDQSWQVQLSEFVLMNNTYREKRNYACGIAYGEKKMARLLFFVARIFHSIRTKLRNVASK